MLNADGAYFVFALGSGDPWLLKWADLPTRISTYLFTVVPTECVLQIWKLTGSEIAVVNGLTFYGFQLIQFLIVVGLAWPRFSRLLIFPVILIHVCSFTRLQWAPGGRPRVPPKCANICALTTRLGRTRPVR